MKMTKGDTTVELIEENGVVQVKIYTEDGVVYLNDELIYSVGNDVEEFKYIPQRFHKFILDSKMDYIEHDPKEKITTVDCHPNDEPLTFYFPMNKKAQIVARIDFITSVSDIATEYGVSKNEEEFHKDLELLEKMFQDVIDTVKLKGYDFKYSHAVGDWVYAWWDVIFPMDKFDENKIMEIMEKIKSFNSRLRQIKDKYEFY